MDAQQTGNIDLVAFYKYSNWLPDLRSLPEQLLLLQPQPLLLHLLEPHLTVGARRQLSPLLHRSALCNPLLVHGCGENKRGAIIYQNWNKLGIFRGFSDLYPKRIREEEGHKAPLALLYINTLTPPAGLTRGCMISLHNKTGCFVFFFSTLRPY